MNIIKNGIRVKGKIQIDGFCFSNKVTSISHSSFSDEDEPSKIEENLTQDPNQYLS
jgi:hypothetical protein